MKLADLLEKFNVVIDNTEGLNKLRPLILGLAMAGKISTQNGHESVDDEIKKYDLGKNGLYPNNWTCVKVKHIVDTQNGYAFKSKQFNDVGHGMPLIRIRDLFSIDTQAYYEGEFSDDYIVYQDDLLVGMDGNFNVALWQGPDALLNQRVCRLFPNSKYLKKKLMYFFIQKFLNDIHEETTYTTVKHLSAKQIKSIKFPLPPLTEQHRIVERIECLFAEVDELETKLNRQGKLDVKLQMAVNAEVQKAPDAEASKSAWNFITSNFDTLYHTPEVIDNLKKNILNEAVRGRLVPQNTIDEPASELLKKIEVEKQRLYKDGEIRKPKELPPIKGNEVPFEIPENWEWCRFGEVIELVSGQHIKSADYNEENNGVPYLTGPTDFGEVYPVIAKWTDKPKVCAIKDDILLTVKGSGVGKINMVDIDEICISRQLMAIRPMLISNQLSYYFLKSRKQTINELSIGIAIPGISREDVTDLYFALPPLKEQKRIVQRIEELFAICDRFKDQLEQREKVNGRLVKGLVQEVLQGS